MTETTTHEAERGSAAGGARRMGLHFSLVLLVAMAGGALLGLIEAWSAGLGVALSGANMLVMRQIMRALTGGSGAAAAWALAFPVKLVVLVGLAFFLVQRGVAKPVPLAIGFALLPLSGVFLPRGSLQSTAGRGAAPEGRRRGRALDVPEPPMKHRA